MSMTSTLRRYPMISKWLSPWIEQLNQLGGPDDYKVILSEIAESQHQALQHEHHRNLSRLDHHLCVASEVCSNLASLVSERRGLRRDLDEANRLVLDKLAEIRAVVGMHRLGFDSIEFTGTPDFAAVLGPTRFLVEVTRLAASMGNRSDVWDAQAGSLEIGWQLNVAYGPEGKSGDRLAEAIYRETEEKCRQLKKSREQCGMWVVWISLGRDYLSAGRYELPSVGVWSSMTIPRVALQKAMTQIRELGMYGSLGHVVLALGRDLHDLVEPEFHGDG